MRRLVLIAALLAPSTALAHLTLVYPPPRTTSQKAQVCGAANSTRGTNVTVLAPGATITVIWKETINHPGHYRIAFDDDGQDFPIPATSMPGATSGMPTVLVDPIADSQDPLPAGGREYTQQITLPNIECDNCTLQVFQMMTDKPPYTIDAASNDIYYQCADITLTNSPPPPPPGDAGVPDAPDDNNPGGGNVEGGGCSSVPGAGLLIGLALLGVRRRRR